MALLAFVCGDYLAQVVPLERLLGGGHASALFAATAVLLLTGLLAPIRTPFSQAPLP